MPAGFNCSIRAVCFLQREAGCVSYREKQGVFLTERSRVRFWRGAGGCHVTGDKALWSYSPNGVRRRVL